MLKKESCHSTLQIWVIHSTIRLGKIDAMMPHEGSPMADQVPTEWRHKIMHAHLTLGDQALMGSDCPPGTYEEPKGFSVSLNLESAEEADRIFQALGEGGKVQMPIQETFWADRFGMVVDRFGTPWMINCDQSV